MVSDMAVLVKALVCVLFTTAVSTGTTQIRGTITIDGTASDNADYPVPTRFLSGADWAEKNEELKLAWRNGDRFDRIFQVPSMGSNICYLGEFREIKSHCPIRHSTSKSECRLNATVYNHDMMIYLGFEMVSTGNATLFFGLQDSPPKREFYRAGNQRGTFQLYYMGTRELRRNQTKPFTLRCQPRNRYERCSIRKLVLLAYQAKYSDCAHR